jgi:hypothetical protein
MFRDTLDPRRGQLPVWPRPSYWHLMGMSIRAQGQDSDLRLELDSPCRLRYWTSRLTVADRPQTESGHYEGMYPRIFVEAEIDGEWVLIDGYQGNLI